MLRCHVSVTYNISTPSAIHRFCRGGGKISCSRIADCLHDASPGSEMGVLFQLRAVCRNRPELKLITNGILCRIDVIGYGHFPHFCRKQPLWSLLLNKSHARLPRVPVLRGQSAALCMGGRGNRVSCEWPREDESRRESSCGRPIAGMLKRRWKKRASSIRTRPLR